MITSARPTWFLRENVPRATDLRPDGYAVADFLLDQATLDAGDDTGHEFGRRRRFWFGVRGRRRAPELRASLNFALWLRPAHEARQSLCGDRRSSFIPGGQAEAKAIRRGEIEKVDRSSHASTVYSIPELLEAQGLPGDLFAHSPATKAGQRTMIGNAVPLDLAEALGRAVVSALEEEISTDDLVAPDEIVPTERTSGGHVLVCRTCTRPAAWLNWQQLCASCLNA